jgi:multiple sugar transport system permease protein/putative aldouronate transport system permease protein
VLKNRNKIKHTKQDLILEAFSYLFIILFCLFCLLPFIMVISSSFENELVIAREGFALWPRQFTTEAYKMIFKTNPIYNAYGVTLFITVVGTVISMLFTITMAYPLAQKKLKFKTPIIYYVFITMLFSGGLVPTYLLISKYLHMRDNIWVLILPTAFSSWNMFLMRNFFKNIPDELSESAYIDGANDMIILFKIILPVAVPGIATISLFYALGYWNTWYNAMLYIDNSKMYPLQYYIMSISRNIEAMKEMASQTGQALSNVPAVTIRMATAVVTIGPIVFVYPYVQKYFTAGLTVGAIKG